MALTPKPAVQKILNQATELDNAFRQVIIELTALHSLITSLVNRDDLVVDGRTNMKDTISAQYFNDQGEVVSLQEYWNELISEMAVAILENEDE